MDFRLINFRGDSKRVSKKLITSGHRGRNLTPVLLKIGEDMMRVEGIVFSSQGRRGGGSWSALSPDYAKRKSDPAILVDTTELIDSLTKPGATGQILNFGRESIEFGTTREASAANQFGSPSTGLPARPFLRFTSYDVRRWNNWLRKYIVDGLL